MKIVPKPKPFVKKPAPTAARIRQLRAMDYRLYLLSPEWKQTRQRALDRAGWRCAICNGREKLQVHHRTYANLGCEKNADLTALCSPCHELYHSRKKRRI
jgi:5-methylcytosine-specific restriction endonuclease McrA